MKGFSVKGYEMPYKWYNFVFHTPEIRVAWNLLQNKISYIRSSHRKCSVTKGVLRKFEKFTGKHLCKSFFLNKVIGLRPATLLKRDSGAGVFLWIFRSF